MSKFLFKEPTKNLKIFAGKAKIQNFSIKPEINLSNTGLNLFMCLTLILQRRGEKRLANSTVYNCREHTNRSQLEKVSFSYQLSGLVIKFTSIEYSTQTVLLEEYTPLYEKGIRSKILPSPREGVF